MLTDTQVAKIQKVIAAEDERLPRIFAALADPSRFRIVKLLLTYNDLCVTDIASILEISVPAASQQLRVLELTGIVEPERMGQMICYKVRESDSLVRSIMKLISS